MKEEFDFPAFTISLIEEGIAHVDMKKIKEMVVADVVQLYTCLGNIAKGKKIAVMTTFHGYIPMSDDVMAESMRMEFQKKILATAMVINSTALRIAIKFFTNFHKPKQPRKIFESKESALQWLRKIRQEQDALVLI